MGGKIKSPKEEKIKMKAHKSLSSETRLALLEQSINNINETMLRMENRFDRIDEKFDKIDERFNEIDKKIDEKFNLLDKKFDSKIDTLSVQMHDGFKTINNRIWSNFFWIFGAYAGILGIIAKTQHWF